MPVVNNAQVREGRCECFIFGCYGGGIVAINNRSDLKTHQKHHHTAG